MKKKLYFLIILLVVSLFSCEKDRCWRCIITTRTSSPSSSYTPELNTIGIDTCSLSEREMNAFRQANVKTATETVDGKTITTTTTCVCVVITFL